MPQFRAWRDHRHGENDLYKPFQFPKGVKSRTVKFGIAVVSQEQTTYVSPLVAFTSHNSKTFGHKKKHCKTMIRESDRTSNVKKCTRKWCSDHHSNAHPNEKCYQQQQSGKRWCTYHKNRSHSDDHCYHQRNDSRNSPVGSKAIFYGHSIWGIWELDLGIWGPQILYAYFMG